jgi:hypothetical protein
MALTQVQPGMLGTPQPYNFKNRIINGAMVISQRNGTSSFAQTNGAYNLDRWYGFSFTGGATTGKYTVQQNAGSVTPPVGFKSYLGVTASTATSTSATDIYALSQPIEGYNIADLGWGTADAKTVTLSFWVRSSATGTFGGALKGGQNYPFTYTISSANTWEQKSVTVAGSTSGTWQSTNSSGVEVVFGLQVGTTYTATAGSWTASAIYSATGCVNLLNNSGATFYITGVQLEQGVTATTFDYRAYGTELALCQRYFQSCVIGTNENGTSGYVFGYNSASSSWASTYQLPVIMRGTPTITKIGTWGVANCGQPTLSALSTGGWRASITMTATGSAISSALTTGLGWTAEIEL